LTIYVNTRDLDDLYLIKNRFSLNFKEIINILNKKELSKPISKESLSENIQLKMAPKFLDQYHKALAHVVISKSFMLA